MRSKSIKISLLTGGKDPTYVLPLLSALISKGIIVDFIGSDSMLSSKVKNNKYVKFFIFHRYAGTNDSIWVKITKIFKMYTRYLKYVPKTNVKLFHIQWENKVKLFDWTFMNIYYKIFGKKLVFTAHNINDKQRDGSDSYMYRLSLKFLYRIVDHIFVHTKQMKQLLKENYKINNEKVTVIPFGINNIMPDSGISRNDSRIKLQLKIFDKVILFFGNIAPYKGLENLIIALTYLKNRVKNLKLIIGGPIKKNCGEYWENINKIIKQQNLTDFVIQRVEYIPDDEVELYFKASDVLVLPYKFIFQSGPLFLAYNFGLPVIVTEVGSFKEDIVIGKTGYIAKPNDPEDLSDKIYDYFQSDLYKNLDKNRHFIKKYANENYSWEIIAEKTIKIYKNFL